MFAWARRRSEGNGTQLPPRLRAVPRSTNNAGSGSFNANARSPNTRANFLNGDITNGTRSTNNAGSGSFNASATNNTRAANNRTKYLNNRTKYLNGANNGTRSANDGNKYLNEIARRSAIRVPTTTTGGSRNNNNNTPLGRLQSRLRTENVNARSPSNDRPILRFGNDGRLLTNGTAPKRFPAPQVACQTTSNANGLHGKAFRACFTGHLQTAVGPLLASSAAARGNAAKMNAMCSAAQLGPHQAVVYEIAKLMSAVPPEKLGEHRGLLVWANAGSGKCFAKDTPVLMHDGTVKAVQDIEVGERVMGDDSTPRTVLSLARGVEDMYELVPTHKAVVRDALARERGFTCNASHVLVLTYVNHKRVRKARRAFACTYTTGTALRSKQFESLEKAEEFCASLSDDSTLEIEVADFLRLPTSVRRNLKLFTASFVEFPAPLEPPRFDPWTLGAWLGDGTSARAEFTWIDSEMTEALETACTSWGCAVERHPARMQVRVVSASNKGAKGSNALLNALNYYSMLNDKHIPHALLTGSKETRLALLAGLLDTDGCLYNNCYEITQKNERLARGIVFLARSLGYKATIGSVLKSCVYNGEKREGTYFRVAISGESLDRIPVVLDRKRASPRLQRKNARHFGFDIVPQGMGEYYGFSVDGNHRFLLGNFAVTHNSITSLAVIMAFWASEKRIVLVSSTTNTAQAMATYKREGPRFFPAEVKMIADEYRKRKGAQGMSDNAAFEIALAERIKGLTFVEARNRIAAAKGEFKTIKDVRLYADAGSVLIIDEAQGLAMKSDGDSSGDAIKLGCALRGLSKDKLRKVHVFAMTATPGNSVREWLKLLSVVRRADQRPFTHDNDALCAPKSPSSPGSGARDWGAVIEKDLANNSMGFYQKLYAEIFGLVSYVDLRSDGSRHACAKERVMNIEMDLHYFLLMLRANILSRRAVKTVADKAEHRYDPKNPKLYMKKMRVLGDSLPDALWSKVLPREQKDGIVASKKLMQTNARAPARYVSNKIVHLVDHLATSPGKQYVYTVQGNEQLLAACMQRWGRMVDVTRYAEIFDGASYNKNTETVSKIPAGPNNFVVLTGTMNKEQRERITQIFNSPPNVQGRYIRVVVATGQLYEGLDLAGLRYVHLCEPLPSPLQDVQAIGRGVRNCSHRGLPVIDRRVTVTRWFSSVSPDGIAALRAGVAHVENAKVTAAQIMEEYDRLNADSITGKPVGYDEAVFNRSRTDPSYKILYNFENAVKTMAVDCAVLGSFHAGVKCGVPPVVAPPGSVLPGSACAKR